MNRMSNLKFDVSSILQMAKNLPKPKVKGVSINLPFLSIDLSASDDERKIAREVLIRLKDKRVLVAWQCCGDCIKHALDSIQDIRTLLVDKQVEISDENSALFIIFDLMLSGIRQFLTFTERYDPYLNKEEFQNAIDILRGHIIRCIDEVAKVGNTTPPTFYRQNFNQKWEETIYLLESPPSDNNSTKS
jgi:hypothetical protein